MSWVTGQNGFILELGTWEWIGLGWVEPRHSFFFSLCIMNQCEYG